MVKNNENYSYIKTSVGYSVNFFRYNSIVRSLHARVSDVSVIVLPHFKAAQYDLGPNLLATHSVNWVKLKGVTWRTNNIVTVDILEETSLPTFSLIETILLTT